MMQVAETAAASAGWCCRQPWSTQIVLNMAAA